MAIYFLVHLYIKLCFLIETVYVSTYKLKFLYAIYDQSMEPNKVECLDNNNLLRVSGYNALLSNVVREACFQTANRVEIFAWNEVFVDETIKKPSMDMTIISPFWIIIGSREINFDGRDGKNLPKANDSQSEMEPGTNGEDGEPGGWGGRFMAFGYSFNQTIDSLHLNGGEGAQGQDGGNGKNVSNI